MDEFKHIISQQIVLILIIRCYFFFHLLKDNGDLLCLFIRNFKNGITTGLKNRQFVWGHAAFVLFKECICEYTKGSGLIFILGNPVIWNFRRGKKQGIIFHLNNFISILHFILSPDEADFIIGPAVVGHRVLSLYFTQGFNNIKNV